LTELLKPIPIVIAVSVVTALVDPFKALFLPSSGNFQPRFRPVAPDGQPPLAFVLDTADFVYAASVPIGLICLGSALGRDVPARRDYCARLGEDGRHASAWRWDHATVRARWFCGSRR
jgi:hypothetical protein